MNEVYKSNNPNETVPTQAESDESVTSIEKFVAFTKKWGPVIIRRHFDKSLVGDNVYAGMTLTQLAASYADTVTGIAQYNKLLQPGHEIIITVTDVETFQIELEVLQVT